MITRKVAAALNIYFTHSLQVLSQFCYDTCGERIRRYILFRRISSLTTQLFFLNFAKKRQLTKIGTNCKGSNREKEMIDKLDKGFECLYFSSNQ